MATLMTRPRILIVTVLLVATGGGRRELGSHAILPARSADGNR